MSSEPIRSTVRIFREDLYNQSFDLEFFREDLGEEISKQSIWTPISFIAAVGESLRILCGEAIEIMVANPPEEPSVLQVEIDYHIEGLLLKAHTVYASSRLELADKEAESLRLCDLMLPQITEGLRPIIGGN